LAAVTARVFIIICLFIIYAVFGVKPLQQSCNRAATELQHAAAPSGG
jgi:hypothetical protein